MAGFGSLSAEDEAAMMPETFANPAVNAIIKGTADMVAAPGHLIAPNPYPPGSEEASWYEDQRTKGGDEWARNMALNTIGTGASFAKAGALGSAGGKLTQPLVKSSELATPYHDMLEPPSSLAYNALHGYPDAEAAAAARPATEAGVDVGTGLAGPSGGGAGVREAELSAERRASGRPTLQGLPTGPQVVAGEAFIPGPVGRVHDVADRYMADRDFGSYHKPPDKYHALDPEHSTAIAKAYDEMPHTPNDPATKASYDALIKETLAQYRAIKDSGLKITPVGGAEYPYHGNPREVAKDVADNNHMAFFKTDEGFGTDGAMHPDNPMLRSSGEKIGDHDLLNNDLFRIVHDYFGHIKNGYGFRATGEDNAWRAHAAMYSDLARPAMTTETRGQNSWVNYGPHGEFNRTASGADTRYADQKVGLMPEWTMRDRGSPEPIIAYHGSPYSFDRFSMDNIGGGEGNQAYGHGLYFAGHSPVSEWYRHQLAARRDPLLEKYGLDQEQGAHLGISLAAEGGDHKPVVEAIQQGLDQLKADRAAGRTDKATQNMIRDREAKIAYLNDPERANGHMYQVAIDHPPEHFLDWDRPLSEQSQHVREAYQQLKGGADPNASAAKVRSLQDQMAKLAEDRDPVTNVMRDERQWSRLARERDAAWEDWNSAQSGQNFYRSMGRPVSAAQAIKRAGIPGIRYLDQGSRGKNTGTHNYVTFDAPRILKKYAVPGLIGAGGFGSLAPGEER
jgi:hypothetical protein